jgi:hypothetical protein
MVSENDNVFNVKYNRYLKQTIGSHGYLGVSLCKNGTMRTYNIHRLVANAFIENPENKRNVDHINNVKTDNRVSNLRFATHQENSCSSKLNIKNTSGYKGVYFSNSQNKWFAEIRSNDKRVVRSFHTKEEAVAFRQQKALEFFGDFVNACERKMKITIEIN